MKRVSRRPRTARSWRGSPAPRLSLFLCAPFALLIAVSEPAPSPTPAGLGSAPGHLGRGAHFTSFAVRIAAKPSSARAKSGKESAFASRRQVPPQSRPSQSQLQLFPFRLAFPGLRRAGAGPLGVERWPAAAGGGRRERRSWREWVGGWGGEEGERTGGEREGEGVCGRGEREGGGDSAFAAPSRGGQGVGGGEGS